MDKSWPDRLHAYLGGAIRETGGTPEEINGLADHVHWLVGLRATHCLADVLCNIKRASSEWVHTQIKQSKFPWQTGYATLTVSPSHRARVGEYIRNEEYHHRKKTFQEEYVEFPKKSGICL